MSISMTLIFSCDNCHHTASDHFPLEYLAEGAVHAMADDLTRRGWEIMKGPANEILTIHCPECLHPYPTSSDL